MELVGPNSANLGGCIESVGLDIRNKLEYMEEVPNKNFEVSDARASWEHRWDHLAHSNPCI